MTTTGNIRPLTLALLAALEQDEWPSHAVCTDFGIASPAHLGALQHAVLTDGVTPEQLDRALGDGPALQALIGPTNPYRDAAFRTGWDGLPEEPEES